MKKISLCLILAAAANMANAGEFDCLIQPKQTVEIRPSISGSIEKIMVDRGDRVHAGQVLFTLDSKLDKANAELAAYRSTMEGAVLAAQSRLEFATTKYQRQELLQAEDFAPAQAKEEALSQKKLADAELKEARDNLKVAELELKRSNEQLRLRTITSPINGIVLARNMQPGEQADSSSKVPLLKLVDISTLYIESLLPLEAFGSVKVGQQLDIIPEALGGSYQAKVKIVDKVIDTASGTFGVRLEVANKAGLLPAGIKCKLSVPNINARSGLKK